MADNGETKTSVRLVSLDVPSDLERMLAISKNRKTLKWMDDVYKLTDDDIEEWIEDSEYSSEPDNDDPWWEITYAVTCSAEIVGQSEEGKLQGFVNFYTDDEVEARFERNKHLVDFEIPSNAVIVEVSVGKWSKAPKRIMSSGLRQAAKDLKIIKAKNPLILIAYIDPNNIPSINAFENAHFRKYGLVYYDIDDYLDSLEDDGVQLFVLDWEKLN